MSPMLRRPTIDQYYISLLPLIAARSTCPRGKPVGAIIVNSYGHIISTGYNGVPSKWPHCDGCVSAGENPGHPKRCYAVHAEVNAILQVDGKPDATTMYVSRVPCFYCSLIIASTCISQVICASEEGISHGPAVLEKDGKLWVWDKETEHAQKIAF